MLDRTKFGTLSGWNRVWAVAAIHGEAERLRRMHHQIARLFQPRDRLVYLGNYLGYGPDILGTLDELITFRREVLAVPGMMPQDIVFLRGAQEEMWQKLLQLQLAMNPRDVFDWMIERGVAASVAAYGIDPDTGTISARAGAVALTRWTGALRDAQRARPGHSHLMTQLGRAAVTEEGSILFVHSGLDPTRPLETQRDAFWWNPGGFAAINEPFGGFRMVVRGFDPGGGGVALGDHTMTLDAGCGLGGPLFAVCLDRDINVIEQLEA
jgi:serine/threonine protein phosphatase 1